MNRIGADVKFRDGTSFLGDPVRTLAELRDLGFEGVLVRTLDEAFPTLDGGAIGEFAEEAARQGMFVQMGLGKVNPYMTAELPRVRDLGGGSYLAGMERMIGICAEHGWTEAWTATGGYQHDLPAPFCFDRFRTDVEWHHQLEATARFLRLLAPSLRAAGVRINLETHEEITTFEILRLVEDIGPDVLGVCLDPANLPVRGELVPDAVRRVAPYVNMTHLRDAVLVPTGAGPARFLAPVGRGVIDWPDLLGCVLAARPGLDLVIEGIGGSRAEMLLCPDDPDWRAAHPDMTDADAAALRALAAGFDDLVATGRAPSLASLRSSPPRAADHRRFLTESLSALRARVASCSGAPSRDLEDNSNAAEARADGSRRGGRL
ncbi:sugar phosphate isomerase/epimerase family protein [Streptomyces sp. NPDC058067]|uniref:sugar phosphate isomerase/epimerase family protein n=1 Tax=Streptomyces sp. NPDC058067 TaxID=3346324 RepID=UPI0036EC51EF